MSLNVCTFKGRVGKDAVTRATPSGKVVTGFSLAVDVGWGERKSTVWIDCALWGERGEKLARHLVKGSQPTVSGELGTREHEGKTYITLNVRECDPEWQADAAPTQRERGAPQPMQDDFDDGFIPF